MNASKSLSVIFAKIFVKEKRKDYKRPPVERQRERRERVSLRDTKKIIFGKKTEIETTEKGRERERDEIIFFTVCFIYVERLLSSPKC